MVSKDLFQAIIDPNKLQKMVAKLTNQLNLSVLKSQHSINLIGFNSYAKLKFKLVPSFFHKVVQKLAKNLVYLSKIIVLGNQCNLTTYLKNKVEILVVSLVFVQAMKCAMFENLSTTT